MDYVQEKTKKARAGKGRITLETLTAIASNVAVEFQFEVRRSDTGEPHATTFWTKNAAGKNSADLAKGSDVTFVVSVSGFGQKKLRAWKSHDHDLIFTYRMRPLPPG